MDGVSQVVAQLDQLPAGGVCAAVGLLAALETATLLGFVLPVESALLLLGFLVQQGTVPMGAALVTAAAGAAAGDAAAFALARRARSAGDTSMAGRLSRRRGWRRASGALVGRGGWRIVLSRSVPFVRTLLPRLAGRSTLPARRYLLLDAVGVTVWVTASVLAGWAAGSSWDRLGPQAGIAVVAVLVMLLVLPHVRLPGRGRNGKGP